MHEAVVGSGAPQTDSCLQDGQGGVTSSMVASEYWC